MEPNTDQTLDVQYKKTLRVLVSLQDTLNDLIALKEGRASIQTLSLEELYYKFQPDDPHVLAAMSRVRRQYAIECFSRTTDTKSPGKIRKRDHALINLLASAPYPHKYEAFENRLARTIALKLSKYLSRNFSMRAALQEGADLKFCRAVHAAQTEALKELYEGPVTKARHVTTFSTSRRAFRYLNRKTKDTIYPLGIFYSAQPDKPDAEFKRLKTKSKKNIIGLNAHADAKVMKSKQRAAMLTVHETLHLHIIQTFNHCVTSNPRNLGVHETMAVFERAACEAIWQYPQKSPEKRGPYRCVLEERMAHSLMRKVIDYMLGKPRRTERDILLQDIRRYSGLKRAQNLRDFLDRFDRARDEIKKLRVPKTVHFKVVVSEDSPQPR